MPTYRSYPMVLNGIFIGMVGVRSDQENYFEIPQPTPAELTLAQYRTSGTDGSRKRFKERLDSTAPEGTAVAVKRTARTRNRSKDNPMRGGRAIKIPTELTSTPAVAPSTDPNNVRIPKPNIRFTTIKFPGTADLAEISAWLHLKLTAHKPKYMKAPGGRSYPLVPFVGTATGTDTTP